MKKILLLVSVLLLHACTPKVNVVVDSISSPKVINYNKFLVKPGNENCNEEDLQFQEFSTLTEKALESVGFEKSKSLEEAEVAIFLSYGISEPIVHQYLEKEPIYGKTGYVSTTKREGGNDNDFSEKTKCEQSYGVIGYETKVKTEIVFTRYLALTAVDAQCIGSSRVIPLWKTSAESVGPENDLRKLFPAMLSVSKDYFGKSTNGKVSFKIAENDERILKLRSEFN